MAFIAILNAGFMHDDSQPREAVAHNLNACASAITSVLRQRGFIQHSIESAWGQPPRVRRHDVEVMVVDPHYRTFAVCRGLEPVAIAYTNQRAEEADELSPAQLALRAAAYCLHDQTKPQPVWWPGSADQWKPGSQVDNLARAAAILLRAIHKIGEGGNDRVPHVRHIDASQPEITIPRVPDGQPQQRYEDISLAEANALTASPFSLAWRRTDQPVHVADFYRTTATTPAPEPRPGLEPERYFRPVTENGSIPRLQSVPPRDNWNWIYDAMRDRFVDRPIEETRQEPRGNTDDAE